MLKRLSKLFILLLAVWATARFCHFQTQGLRFSKFQENTSPILEKSPPISDELLPICTQKFYYLGRGLQSFSFLSEDKQTVLKIFNNHYQKRLFWLQLLPSISFVKKWKAEKIHYNQTKLRQTFASYQIAFELLQKETGLLYLHPHKSTNLSQRVCVVDRLGIEHFLDLNQIGFALQKKATLTYPYLASLAEEKNELKTQTTFFSLVHFLKRKMDLGIADRDPLLRTNFGFVDDSIIEIDIGPFSFDSSLKNPSRQKEEICKITQSLKHWLENYHPEMLPYLNEALKSL